MYKTIKATIVFLVLATQSLLAQDAKELLAQVKGNLAKSSESLRSYEWMETTVLTQEGKEKSTQVKRCYYGVDGKLYKTPVGADKAAKSPKGGIRGKVAENKKEEISDYVGACMKKVQEYTPPAPDQLQALYAGGKMSIQTLEPNKKFNLSFSDYKQSGDLLAIGLNKESQQLTGVKVKTYVEKKENAVDFSVNYGALPDGTQYPLETTLDMPAKKLKMVIKNDGYKKASGQ
jgi:hypothetical protein